MEVFGGELFICAYVWSANVGWEAWNSDAANKQNHWKGVRLFGRRKPHFTSPKRVNFSLKIA